MSQVQVVAAVLFLLFGLLAFVDGVYLHLWRYRLFAWDESRREHALHTARAFLFPVTVYLLLGVRATGWFLWLAVGVAVLDLVFQAWDLIEERMARRGFGGLSSFEYSLHVWLTGLHVSAVALTLAGRPVGDWSTASSLLQGPLSAFGYEIAWFLLPGAMIGAVGHLVLMHRFFRKGTRAPESMNRAREIGLSPLF